MSKRYQYFAKKRHSHRYFEASTPCKNKQHNNHITCKICLRFTGYTRKIQQEHDKINK
jgi:hypothetical protein